MFYTVKEITGPRLVGRRCRTRYLVFIDLFHKGQVGTYLLGAARLSKSGGAYLKSCLPQDIGIVSE